MRPRRVCVCVCMCEKARERVRARARESESERERERERERLSERLCLFVVAGTAFCVAHHHCSPT